MTTLIHRVEEIISGKRQLKIDPKKITAAFMAGVQYHDALVNYRNNKPDAEEIVTDEELDQAFQTWHELIEKALT